MSCVLVALLWGSARAALPDLSAPDWEWSPDVESGYAGYETEALGDVDGDGYDDFAAVVDYFGTAETTVSQVIGVFHGSADGPETFCREIFDTYPLPYFYYDNLNFTGGDFNGDGLGDLAVGDGYEGTGGDGTLTLYLGSEDGMNALPSWTYAGSSPTETLYLGWGIGSSDVNGDGYDDLIAGAIQYTNGQTAEGALFVFLGSSVGPGSTPNVIVEGGVESGELGWAVEGAGDVNGDGYEDVIAASPFLSNGNTGEGRVSVFHGRATGLRLVPSKIWEPNQDYNWPGYYADHFAGHGDFNGDGYDDVVFGDLNYTNGSAGEGRALAFYGSSAGLHTNPDWVVDGNQVGASLGVVVASAGDVDGDGYDDVLVSSPSYDSTFENEGRIDLFRGGPLGLSPFPDAHALGGAYQMSLGYGATGVGDTNGDGVADFVAAMTPFEDGEENEGRILGWLGIPPEVDGAGIGNADQPFGTALPDHGPAGAGCATVPVTAFELLPLILVASALRRRRCTPSGA